MTKKEAKKIANSLYVHYVNLAYSEARKGRKQEILSNLNEYIDAMMVHINLDTQGTLTRNEMNQIRKSLHDEIHESVIRILGKY